MLTTINNSRSVKLRTLSGPRSAEGRVRRSNVRYNACWVSKLSANHRSLTSDAWLLRFVTGASVFSSRGE